MSRTRVLVVSPFSPFPPIGGARMRTFQLAYGLAERFDVTLVHYHWSGEELEPAPFPVRVIEVPWEPPEGYVAMQSADPEAARDALDTLTRDPGNPWFASYFDTAAMHTALRALGEDLDVAVIEHSYMGGLLASLPPALPKVLDLHNVHSAMAQRAGRPGDWEGERTLRFERGVVERCHAVAACSDLDAEAARDLLGADRIELVPNGVDTSYFVPSEELHEPGRLLFTGTLDYEPNVEGAAFFVSEILPLVRREVPRASFEVVGRNPPASLLALGSEHVTVRGRVDDMRPFLARAEQVVVPLLNGGGTRLKILEAAACAKPIVTTSLGVEGLKLGNDEHLLVADSPRDFAAAVVRLSRDEGLRGALGRRARAASGAYDWRGIRERFSDLVAEIASERRSLGAVTSRS